MVGLETALGISYSALVKTGVITFPALIEAMSSKPAAIAGYTGHGSLENGSLANFALVNVEKPMFVQPNLLYSKSKNTPFANFELPLTIEATYFRGKQVFERGGGGAK